MILSVVDVLRLLQLLLSLYQIVVLDGNEQFADLLVLLSVVVFTNDQFW